MLLISYPSCATTSRHCRLSQRPQAPCRSRKSPCNTLDAFGIYTPHLCTTTAADPLHPVDRSESRLAVVHNATPLRRVLLLSVLRTYSCNTPQRVSSYLPILVRTDNATHRCQVVSLRTAYHFPTIKQTTINAVGTTIPYTIICLRVKFSERISMPIVCKNSFIIVIFRFSTAVCVSGFGSRTKMVAALQSFALLTYPRYYPLRPACLHANYCTSPIWLSV